MTAEGEPQPGVGRKLRLLAIDDEPRILRLMNAVLAGAYALGTIALYRGEALSATWFVIAAVCCYLVAYRLYSAFIAAKLLALDDTRATPAERDHDSGRSISAASGQPGRASLRFRPSAVRSSRERLS